MQLRYTEREVEIIRDRWGVPHVYAEKESDGFFGLGYVCAEDRRLQMELMRRRTLGRVAELFGPDWVESDRTFRLGGIPQHCAEAYANLPSDMQDNLRAYAAGVNAYVETNPEDIERRFASLGVAPEPWTPSDCIAAWMSWGTMFDVFIDDRSFWTYDEVATDEINDQWLFELRAFQKLVTEVGWEKAVELRGRVVDDEVAMVPESEMAKDKEVYARLKAMTPTPGFKVRGVSAQPLRFSHGWIVDGTRSTTGKPIFENDPQTPVNNPAILYEFHLAAGRYDVRGVGAVGSPAVFIGFNRHVSWGGTAFGVGCTVNFLEHLADDGLGCEYQGETRPFERRLERINVKDAEPVIQEVLTNSHGFVINSMARRSRPGEAYVSHYKMAEDGGTSVRAMLEWMKAHNWPEFVDAMEHWYSPGMNLIYADVEGNIAYQALAHIPLTKRSRRWTLEGWTGEDEVLGRIPLAEMPHMVNPDSHVIFSANHMPVGSWYPYDLGLAGGTGEGPRAMRLRQLFAGDRKFSVEDFEAIIHRDNVNPAVAALLPVALKVIEEEAVSDPAVLQVAQVLSNWDMRYDATDPAYWTAMTLSDNVARAYWRTSLPETMGSGISGACHLARLLEARYSKDGATPKDEDVRDFLVKWLRMTAEQLDKSGRSTDGPPKAVPHIRTMPYQANERISYPSANAELDTVSPPLTCGQVQTIWSQQGNSYTQIVDWSDVDNSRSILPPGISEDPASPYYLNQVDIWMEGTTHPAPLSRDKIEALAIGRASPRVAEYDGPDAPADMVVEVVPEGAHFVPAIPAPSAAPAVDRKDAEEPALSDQMYPR